MVILRLRFTKAATNGMARYIIPRTARPISALSGSKGAVSRGAAMWRCSTRPRHGLKSEMTSSQAFRRLSDVPIYYILWCVKKIVLI